MVIHSFKKKQKTVSPCTRTAFYTELRENRMRICTQTSSKIITFEQNNLTPNLENVSPHQKYEFLSTVIKKKTELLLGRVNV